MTSELYRQILAHGGAANLSTRSKFRLTGADRVRYLNGQVTNDIRRVKADETLYACVTDTKGRIVGDVLVHATESALLLDAEPGLRETLGMRLERYIVADDAELADVTEEWQLWHVWGSTTDTPACRGATIDEQECPSYCLRSNRLGVEGFDVWLPADATPPEFDSLPVLSEADLETWRILQKVPRWPNELNAETFPPEAGLETRAMDFAKGCYIGQEILSRIKTTGKMPRQLMAFESETGVSVGDEIRAEEKAVGTVTSVATHPETGKTVGLAMVRQGMTADRLTTVGVVLQPR